MGDAARKLIDQALTLDDTDRELVAVELMASLVDRSPEWEADWGREIDRRVQEVDSGVVALRSWDDVKADLLTRLSRK